MCAGYGLGEVFTLDRPRRRRLLVALGLTALLAFVIVRGVNGYGDPSRWAVQRYDPASSRRFDPSPPTDAWGHFPSPPAPSATEPDPLYTVMSFVNTTKYPPSLDYLLMTLGTALLFLAAFDRPLGTRARPLIVFGRVPLFFYLLHLPLILALAAGVYWFGRSAGWYGSLDDARRTGLGLSLPATYLWWVFVVFLLYFPCRWFASVKERSRHPLLSYL
jgi:hypothetical protein